MLVFLIFVRQQSRIVYAIVKRTNTNNLLYIICMLTHSKFLLNQINLSTNKYCIKHQRDKQIVFAYPAGV